LLTTKEISEMLHVSEETVRRWIRTGELEATQDGKSYLVDKSHLESFIKKKSMTPGTSLAKMVPIIGGIIGHPKTRSVATELLNKFLKEKEVSPNRAPSIADYEEHIEDLKRQKKKLELEYQMKLLEIEDEIANYQKLMKNLRKETDNE
jgi:excisionase family DNA binding protein